MTQVDRDNHCEKIVERSCRISFDFRSRGGILRLRRDTIFDTFSESLALVSKHLASKENTKYSRIQNDGIIYCPEIFEDELHKQRFEGTPFQMLVADDTLRFGVQVEIAP